MGVNRLKIELASDQEDHGAHPPNAVQAAIPTSTHGWADEIHAADWPSASREPSVHSAHQFSAHCGIAHSLRGP